jgi:murein DD-endopeptidase MepM/ murein hydrolase activator NlpD
MSDDLNVDMSGLLGTMEKMDKVVKSITASVKEFSTALNGTGKGANKGNFAGFGQLGLGSSGGNIMSNSFGNIPQMLAGNRSMNMWGSVASNGLKIAGSLVGGAFMGMPDVAATTARSTAYYDVGTIQGAGRNRIANATFSAMRGGLTSAGSDAMTAGVLTNMGVSFSAGKDSQYMNLARSTANAAKYLNMDNGKAAAALGGLTQGNTSQSLMRNFGIFTTDPNTGRRLSPTEIFASLNQRMTGGRKLTAKQLQTSMQGGALAVNLQNSGLSGDQQQLAYQYMLDKARGKNMDLGNDKLMARLQKENGAGDNPMSSVYSANTSATATMQSASDAYIDGMKKAAGVIEQFNKAMQGFLRSPMGNAMAQMNAGVNLGMGDPATGGMLGGLGGALGGVGNIGGMMLQNHMLAKTMQGLTGGGRGVAGGNGIVSPGTVNAKGKAVKPTKLPKGYKFAKGGRVYNESAKRFATSAETEKIAARSGGMFKSVGGKLLRLGGGAMAGGFAGDLVSGGVQALGGSKDAGFWAGLGTSVAVGEAVGGAETFGISGLISGGIYAASHWDQAASAFGNLGNSIGKFFGGGGAEGKSQTDSRTSDTSNGIKLIHPVGHAKCTTRYGQTDKIHKIPHLAIDWGVGTGTPVQAGADGTVVGTGGTSTNTMGTSNHSYGLWVEIDHGNGYSTWYAHLSSVGVSKGATVKQGQTIALSGNTGYSTGPHLHFELRKGSQKIDPSAALGKNYAAVTGYSDNSDSSAGEMDSASGSAGTAGLLGFSTSPQQIAGIAVPPSYTGAGAESSVSSAGGSSNTLGHGQSTTGTGGSVGNGMGGGGDSPSGRGGGGNTVNISLNIASASESEARRFAKLIKGYLEEEKLVSSMGVL